MMLREHVPLSSLTTLKTGGTVRYVALCETVEDITEALTVAHTNGVSFYVLGEGSNVLPSDAGYDGVVIQPRINGVTFEEEGDRVRVISGAGVHWDDLVRDVAARGLWGIENLAGIPGTVGAAPVQNIGAYGMELAGTLAYVDALDVTTGEVTRIATDRCGLGYRDSRFKHEPNWIITHVALTLTKNGAPKIEYGDLLRARDEGKDLSTPAAIGEVVRAVRAGKFPDLTTHGTAGSFFKNPVLSEAKYAELVQSFGTVPQFPNPNGIKIPLAFVLDHVLRLRGFRMGHAWLFGAQPLVLVLDQGGSAGEIEALAHEVEQRVFDATGITIEREVRSMPTK